MAGELENKVDGGTPLEDTSKENLVGAEKKFDQDGNEIAEEPENKDTPPDDGKGDGDVEPPPKPSYKYASMDEYDKAYKEAERKMHEATTRASTLEKELNQFKKPPEKPASTIDDKITEIMSDARKQIKALPVKYDDQGHETAESLEYRETQATIIYGKANRKIARMEYDEAANVQAKEKDVANKLYKKATSEGLASNDELDLVGIEYGRTDPSLSADERINSAVDAVKSRVSRLREGFVKRQQPTKKELEDLKVLGGGSHNRPTDGGKTKPLSKPSSMSDALTDINSKRKMRAEDVLK